ncbi:MAG: HAMP domain-containing histidine kinase [Eubacterium sp.]|nr:HAMP domain-containing histidine kinase [Eubacterium sp.]
MKPDNQKKSMRNQLILYFIGMLAAIMVSEALISLLIARLIQPAVQAGFLQNSIWDTEMSASQFLVFLSGTVLLAVLRFLGGMFPVFGSWILFLEERLAAWMTQHVPQSAESPYIRDLSGKEGVILFLILFGILLLKLLPYIVFGMLYIRYVVRSTDRIRARDAQYYTDLEKEKNRMLSDIAHDIKNPITTVAGYAQALDEGMVKDPEKQREYLQAIRNKSRRVNDLIELLFEYAKLNSSGFSLEKKQIDLCELLRQNAAEMYADAEEQQMEIVPEIPEEPIRIWADPVQLSRVIINLLTNAIRYNPPGTAILAALQKDAAGNGDIQLTIADTGSVIPEEVAGRIFEPFSRGDTARPTDGGSGLGLSIAESIVRMHGWELSLQTDIPEYTKGFVIRIPW